MNKKDKLLILVIMILSLFITTGFTSVSRTPKEVYRVYIKGKSLGLIESKKELEEYIDNKQKSIKKKFNVKKVYAPSDLDIKKEITYSTDIKSNDEIYEEIKDISPFTISGYMIKIRQLDSKDANGKKIKGKTQKIYVLDRDVFEKSMEKTSKSFIPEESYEKYKNDEQTKIKDTGELIENIYVKNKVTITKQKIPVDEKIYQDEGELSKYLLFGTTEDQAKYVVKAGDTIADVSFANKISVEEFLIANPDLSDENSLLTEGQVVTLGVLNPQISIVEEEHVVKDEESNYPSETVEDPNKCNNVQEVTQPGVKGLNRVTQKVQKVNGETTNTVTVNTEVIKESTKEIITKGTKECAPSGWSGGYGDLIVTKGMFGWPATCSTVSSGFGYRWGTLHDGTDIAGCGYGSNIFAAESGTVYTVGYKYDNGQYITIAHDNGYYTMYAHLCSGCTYVKEGDRVTRGQPIGGMGQTGFATGVHLHFAIWTGPPYAGGRALNAMQFY